MDRLGDGRGGLVVASAGDKRRHLDLTQTIPNVPLLQCTGRVELTRSEHSVIDLGVGRELGKGARQGLRPRIKPTDMTPVEDLHRFLVGHIIGGAGLLMVTERLLHLLGELLAQTVGLVYPLGYAGW